MIHIKHKVSDVAEKPDTLKAAPPVQSICDTS